MSKMSQRKLGGRKIDNDDATEKKLLHALLLAYLAINTEQKIILVALML